MSEEMVKRLALPNVERNLLQASIVQFREEGYLS